jgi:hypothetical protein
MTPLEISRFMSEQFIIDKITLKLLEPGIGSGVLACSLCEYIAQKNKKVNRIESRTKKHFMDLIKMISYRAETAMTYIINEKAMDIDEARCLLKQIYKTEVDLKVNEKEKILEVHLHNLNNKSTDDIVRHLCKDLNNTETVFPGTELKMVYKVLGD